MSSSNDIPLSVPEDNHNKETKLTTPPAATNPSNGLSLFDQLKNSVDHNSVTKTALNSNAQQRHEDKLKSQPKNEQESNVADTTALPPPPSPPTPVVKIKPEFQTPTLFPPPSSNGNASYLGSAASTKRLQNANTKFPLKPPNSKDLTTTLRSLKRSQPPPPPPTNFAATQKTGPLAYSSTAAVGAAAAAALSSTAVGSTVSRHSSAAAADSTSSINHNAKKKRCTDRYDSSESSDRKNA